MDAAGFEPAVKAASAVLDGSQDYAFDAQVFIGYIRRIIEQMGGAGAGLEACAREIYAEWAANQHFSLYDDVAPVLRDLAAAGLPPRPDLQHAPLPHLVPGALRPCRAHQRSHLVLEHGYNKPHPSIFRTALRLLQVRPEEAVMVGDNLKQDIEGALNVGMGAVLVCRSGTPCGPSDGDDGLAETRGAVPVIRSLHDLLPPD